MCATFSVATILKKKHDSNMNEKRWKWSFLLTQSFTEYLMLYVIYLIAQTNMKQKYNQWHKNKTKIASKIHLYIAIINEQFLLSLSSYRVYRINDYNRQGIPSLEHIYHISIKISTIFLHIGIVRASLSMS